MKDLAKYMAAHGRNGDTELLHVTKGELASLQGIGALAGKRLTINPHTGLPEAFNFKQLIPAIVGIGATALSGGTLSPLMAGMISGAATTAATGDIKQGLVSGISGGMMSGLGQGLAGMAGGAGAAGAGAGEAINSASHFSDAAFDAGLASAATPAVGAGAAAAAAPAMSASTFGQNMMDPAKWSEQFGGANMMGRTIPGLTALAGTVGNAMTPDMSKGGGGDWKTDEFAQKEKTSERDFAMPTDPYYAMKGGEHRYFSDPRYNFAKGGGITDLPQGVSQDSGMMKVIKSIRSRYRSRAAAMEDMKIPNSFMQRLGVQDPNDPVLDYAFGYTSKQGQRRQKSGNLMMPMMAEGGAVAGMGDGMSDDVPAMIEGQQPARLARDEYVFPADAVSHLGNGSSAAGHEQLDNFVARLRQARTGQARQAPAINPRKVMPK